MSLAPIGIRAGSSILLSSINALTAGVDGVTIERLDLREADGEGARLEHARVRQRAAAEVPDRSGPLGA